MVGQEEMDSEVEDPGRCDAIMAVERNVQEVLQTVLQRQKAVHWKEAGRERESGEACGPEAMGETRFQTCDGRGERRVRRHHGAKRCQMGIDSFSMLFIGSKSKHFSLFLCYFSLLDFRSKKRSKASLIITTLFLLF